MSEANPLRTDAMEIYEASEDLKRIVETDLGRHSVAFLEVVKNEDGSIVWLKPLDPRYMRVRRDPTNHHIIGFVQILTFPPVVLSVDEILYFQALGATGDGWSGPFP